MNPIPDCELICCESALRTQAGRAFYGLYKEHEPHGALGTYLWIYCKNCWTGQLRSELYDRGLLARQHFDVPSMYLRHIGHDAVWNNFMREIERLSGIENPLPPPEDWFFGKVSSGAILTPEDVFNARLSAEGEAAAWRFLVALVDGLRELRIDVYAEERGHDPKKHGAALPEAARREIEYARHEAKNEGGC